MSNLELLTEKLRKAGLDRLFWLPITSDSDGNVSASKFSGQPVLAPNESWPLCQNCHQPMQLMVQLNCSELPTEMRELAGTGLIQLFYCVNSDPHCELDCDAWEPFAKSVLARRIHPQTEGLALTLPDGHYPAKQITGWEIGLAEFPGPEEVNEIMSAKGIDWSSEESEQLYTAKIYPSVGEKLGGWPNWIQGVEYPECPECQHSMSFLLQLDSEQNLPYSWGDVGIGHLCVCPQHEQILAFRWAC